MDMNFSEGYKWCIYHEYYHNLSNEAYYHSRFDNFLHSTVNEPSYWSDTIFDYNVEHCDNLYKFVETHHWNEILDLGIHRLCRCLLSSDDWKKCFYNVRSINDDESFTSVPRKCIDLALMKWFEENVQSLINVDKNYNVIVSPRMFAIIRKASGERVSIRYAINISLDEDESQLEMGGLVMPSAKEGVYSDEILKAANKLQNDLNSYKDKSKWFRYDLNKLSLDDYGNIVEK